MPLVAVQELERRARLLVSEVLGSGVARAPRERRPIRRVEACMVAVDCIVRD